MTYVLEHLRQTVCSSGPMDAGNGSKGFGQLSFLLRGGARGQMTGKIVFQS